LALTSTFIDTTRRRTMKKLAQWVRGTAGRVEFCDECSEVTTDGARRRVVEDRARIQAMRGLRVG
jgi:hypothetical protein